MSRPTLRPFRPAFETLESRLTPTTAPAVALAWERGLQMLSKAANPGYGGVLETGTLGAQSPGVNKYQSNPYFAYLGYRALLMSDKVTAADLTNTLKLLQWHLKNNNVDYTIDNLWYDDKAGKAATAPAVTNTPPDSQDSYAAMFLDLTGQYLNAGGDTTWLRDPVVRRQYEFTAQVILTLIQPNGLTFASETATTYYLSDNSEVFAGLQAMARLSRDVWGDQAQADFYYAKAEAVRVGIVNNLYDSASGLFRIATDDTGTNTDFDPAVAYPSYLILTPAVYGVIARDGALAKAQVAAINASPAFTNWQTDNLSLAAATARTALLGFGERLSGDPTVAQAQADKLYATYFPAKVNPAKPAAPMSVNEFGWLLLNTNYHPETAPVTVDGTALLRANRTVEVHPMAVDAEGDNLNYFVIGGPSNGTLTRTATGYLYTPNPGFVGTDSFTFRADDGELDSPRIGTFTITTRGYRFAAGSGVGQASVVQVYESDGTASLTFNPYAREYTGGVAVAVADLNGDNFDDVVTSTGAGGGANIRVFDGATGQLLNSFYAYDAAFTGGVNVALGDLNGDGVPDIVCGVGVGGGPNVRAYDGATGQLLLSFYAYDAAFTGGIRVAVGDVNGDGLADVITTVGSGGGPNVRAYDGRTLALLLSFYAYPDNFTNGLFVAAGDLNGDGVAEIITGVEAGGGPNVRAYDARTQVIRNSFYGFDDTQTGGVRVASHDINGDGNADFLLGTGVGTNARVRVFDGSTGGLLRDTAPFARFTGGVFVG